MPDHRTTAQQRLAVRSQRGLSIRKLGRIAFGGTVLLMALHLAKPVRATARFPENSEEHGKSEGRGPRTNGETKPEKSDSAEPSAEEKSAVSLSGQVAQDSAGPRGVIRFWLTIENRGALPISKVQLRQPQIPGFRLTRLCWPGDKESNCPDLSNEAASQSTAEYSSSSAAPSTPLILLEETLPPESAVTVWGYLEAIKTAPKQVAFLTISWIGLAHSSKTIGLGQVESLSGARAFYLLFTNNWEWTFSIGIPILAFLGTRLLKRWERKRKMRAEELSQQQRIWSLMLKQAQTIGLKYYTPLSGSLQALRDEIETYVKARAKGQTDPMMSSAAESVLAEACYDLLMMQRQLRATLDLVGGYYFKNRDAELLADALYQKHRALLNFSPPLRQTFSAAGLELKTTTTWAEFLAKQNSPASFVQVFWLEFRQHMKNISNEVLETEIRVLDAYAALLNYEVNRPLLYWYGKLRPIQFKYTDSTDHKKVSRDEILKWANEGEKLQLSPSQVQEYELVGKNYLAGVEREVLVEKEKTKLLTRLRRFLAKAKSGPQERPAVQRSA